MIDDETFVKAINASPYTIRLADKLSVSLTTIRRWKEGKNLPHQALREPIS
jgi:uncharacterized protein YjcR